MVMGADSCLFECANPNQQLSRPMTSTSPGAAVDDLGKRLHAALLSSRPTGSFRPTPPPRLLHHILGRAPLAQHKRESWRRWACIFGLLAQPFWFYAAWKAEQWGILAISTLYTYAWARGIRTHWLAPERTGSTPNEGNS